MHIIQKMDITHNVSLLEVLHDLEELHDDMLLLSPIQHASSMAHVSIAGIKGLTSETNHITTDAYKLKFEI